MKKIIRLTESDLTRIVRRVINEGVILTMPNEWNVIDDVVKGDTFKYVNGNLQHLRGGKPYGLYNLYKIVQNPRQVQLKQGGAFNVLSFDNVKKLVTFDNGLVIGPEA